MSVKVSVAIVEFETGSFRVIDQHSTSTTSLLALEHQHPLQTELATAILINTTFQSITAHGRSLQYIMLTSLLIQLTSQHIALSRHRRPL